MISDLHLTQQAISALQNAYYLKQLCFQHGHVAHGDMVDANDQTTVLFPILKWGWYLPLSFFEGWYLYNCANQPNLTPENIRAIHQEQEEAFGWFATSLSPQQKQLLLLSRLERATAFFLIYPSLIEADQQTAFDLIAHTFTFTK